VCVKKNALFRALFFKQLHQPLEEKGEENPWLGTIDPFQPDATGPETMTILAYWMVSPVRIKPIAPGTYFLSSV
jgi:hypothetical protein